MADRLCQKEVALTKRKYDKEKEDAIRAIKELMETESDPDKLEELNDFLLRIESEKPLSGKELEEAKRQLEEQLELKKNVNY